MLPSADDCELIRDHVEKRDRLRRLGVQTMLWPLAVLLTSVWIIVESYAIFGRPPLSAGAGSLAGSILAAVFLPMFGFGVVLFAIGDTGVARNSRAYKLLHLPPLPRLRAGERLGWWVVTRVEPASVHMEKLILPRAVMDLMRTGVESLCLAALVSIWCTALWPTLNGQQQGNLQVIMFMTGVTIIYGFCLSWALAQMRVEITASSVVIHAKMFPRPIPAMRVKVSCDALLQWSSSPLPEVSPGRLGPPKVKVPLPFLSVGALGQWQVRRLMATVSSVA